MMAGHARFFVRLAVVAIALPEDQCWNSINQTASERKVTSVGYTTAAGHTRSWARKRLTIRWTTTVSTTPAIRQNSQSGKYAPSTLRDGEYAHPETKTAAIAAVPVARFACESLANGTCRFKACSPRAKR